MGNKESLLVYPYDIQFAPILRHKNLLDKFEVVGLVSPKGWGFSSKDASCADGGENIGMTVSSDFDSLLASCDTVLFIESDIKLDFEKYIYPRAISAIQAGKNIIAAMDVKRDIEQELIKRCDKHSVYSRFYHASRNRAVVTDEKYKVEEKLLAINTPVVFVLGSGEKTQKFMIQLSLREYFLKNGYRVSQVGSRSYCEFLGFHSIPLEMFAPAMPEDKKIVFFNRCIKMLEKTEEPDVIIIGVPGGIMPYDREFTNKFGFMAFMIANAVEPDVAVFSSVYGDWTPKYFERIAVSIRHKLGFYVDCFNLSNTQINWMESKQLKMIKFNILDAELVEGKKSRYQELKTPVFNALNPKDISLISECLVNKLAEYREVEEFKGGM